MHWDGRRSFLASIKAGGDPSTSDSPQNAAALRASGGGFGTPTMKPFKVPASTTSTRSRQLGGSRSKFHAPGQKREREYDENTFYGDLTTSNEYDPLAAKKARKEAKKAAAEAKAAAEDDSDDGKKGRGGFVDRYVPPSAPRRFPVFRPKTPEQSLNKGFSIPGMKRKGQLVETRPSNLPLGTRRVGDVLPRPLFDPLEDHAVVLWDPTIDDREAEREAEKQRLLQLERDNADDAELARAEAEAEVERRKYHRSLAEILGIVKLDADAKKKMKVPVVIDPRVGKVLRPHQVEGVKFLYRCVTGMTDENAHGCIMADEMGLGKTLQCITLMWTLLKQSPTANRPAIDKAIVVCPSSLVRNWANELVKWLGEGAVSPMAIDGKSSAADNVAQIRQWCSSKGKSVVTPIVIVSYERLRSLTDELGQTEIGLLLADEGHRLKNSGTWKLHRTRTWYCSNPFSWAIAADNQTYTALMSINCKRRVILTGTPIQNDLNEYFSLLSFCNPGYLGTKQEFHKCYEMPILRGRDGEATEKQQEVGSEKLKELSTKVNKFIIRRTNDLLSKYLPVKYEHVVFCALSPFQLALYQRFMHAPETKKLLRGQGSQPLKAITILRKLCNHPDLLDFDEDVPNVDDLFPPGYNPREKRPRYKILETELSGKLAVVDRFLEKMRRETNDKIVLISNFTQTLDVLGQLCSSRKYGFLRLDGTMSTDKRQKLVDRFNDPEGKELVFLLSSKAGGCGINLIGANRLILFDPDWNPASDMQALARVWRDGQKKNCELPLCFAISSVVLRSPHNHTCLLTGFVYRFVATGTVEEKSEFCSHRLIVRCADADQCPSLIAVFQRQSHKQNLSSCVVDSNEDIERHYSGDNLRQLFQYKESKCETHELFKCKRCKNGKQMLKSPAMLYGDTSTWNHLSNACLANIHDDLLRAETGLDTVTACFQYIST
ncbi:BZ3500_MvSof-1268-A1-R1_Chr3-1g05466 [Microbotryum saponariae]|uniref:BZ3500_MvSof-1268-A1-R1_Chr3-1g05466 protein n=1 Tax=Microbotryum saponariae TaxID=289078 RepID=A0A2X0NHM1_9BASI|nr:BZ3500_MvSof-1268-A1-R1_Chr3-1g05466 [Microbotryum saponariae]SDA04657.1 BZ3501_MvSof-1269-A2-R1_Chr3-1g05137 [Microbotryum saponariae]